MILVTKTSDQTRQRGHTLSTCTMYVCMEFTLNHALSEDEHKHKPARMRYSTLSLLFKEKLFPTLFSVLVANPKKTTLHGGQSRS